MTAEPCPFLLALTAWPAIWLVDLLRYLIPASIVAVLLTRLPIAWRSSRWVQARSPAVGQRRREFLNSMLTVLIFSANGVVIFAGVKAGVLQIYGNFAERGWFYAATSLAVLLLA